MHNFGATLPVSNWGMFVMTSAPGFVALSYGGGSGWSHKRHGSVLDDDQ